MSATRIIMGVDEDQSTATSSSAAKMALDMLIYWAGHVQTQAPAIKELLNHQGDDGFDDRKKALTSIQRLIPCLMEMISVSRDDVCPSKDGSNDKGATLSSSPSKKKSQKQQSKKKHAHDGDDDKQDAALVIRQDDDGDDDDGGGCGDSSTQSSAQQQQQQQHVPIVSDASTSAIIPHLPSSSASTRTTTTLPSKSNRELVLSNPDLLLLIIQPLIKANRASLAVLSSLGRVNRRWRDLSRHDELWSHITSTLLPVTAVSNSKKIKERRRGDGCFGYLRDYGHSIIYRPIIMGEDNWFDSFTMAFEIWDEMDDFRFLSASGRLGTLHAENFAVLKLIGQDRHEIVGEPFSAASRDPIHQRFQSMQDYLTRSHEAQFPSSIHMRIIVTHEPTEKMAVLWESTKVQLLVGEPSEVWQQYLPLGSLLIGPSTYVRLISPHQCSCQGGHEGLVANFNFYIQPADAAEGEINHNAPPPVPDVQEQKNKLWQLSGGNQERYTDDNSVVKLGFHETDINAVGRFLWSLFL